MPRQNTTPSGPDFIEADSAAENVIAGALDLVLGKKSPHAHAGCRRLQVIERWSWYHELDSWVLSQQS